MRASTTALSIILFAVVSLCNIDARDQHHLAPAAPATPNLPESPTETTHTTATGWAAFDSAADEWELLFFSTQTVVPEVTSIIHAFETDTAPNSIKEDQYASALVAVIEKEHVAIDKVYYKELASFIATQTYILGAAKESLLAGVARVEEVLARETDVVENGATARGPGGVVVGVVVAAVIVVALL